MMALSPVSVISKALTADRYWNWALSANNLSASPIFDGSPTSLSGDGDPIDTNSMITLDPTNVTVPQGSGGGCVTNGPFANMQLNLPDLSLAGDSVFPQHAFDYTPHCFTRNLNSYISNAFTSQADVNRLLASRDIVALQQNIDFSVWPSLREAGVMGPHAAAHMSLGRTMDDFWTAPQDPSFMLHHAMVDRIWALWQAQGPESRRWALNGTSTIHNAPNTPEVTLDTEMAWGVLSANKTLREVMSTEAYEFCYEYGD
jgi:tyrosinase